MVETTTGGCLCGHIQFEISDQPGPAGYCHCTDCRRVTGSAFNISLPVNVAALRISSGAPKSYTTTADSGAELTRYFCPDCGSPLYTASPRHADVVYVKAGVLDDPTLVRPDHQSWVRSRVPWAAIADDLPAHARGSRDSGD